MATTAAFVALMLGTITIPVSGVASGAVVRPSYPLLDETRLGVPTQPPGEPATPTVIAEGLGILVSWNPNPPSDEVASYASMASIAPGYTGVIPSGCATPPPASAPGTASSVLMGNLCAQIPYVVTLTATNAAGASPASAPSAIAVPLVAQPPSSPLIISVQPRNSALLVGFSPPANPGGDPTIGFRLTASLGKTIVKRLSISPTLTDARLAGLKNGSQYVLGLTALSVAGASPVASATGTPTPRAVPGAPSGLEVVPDGKGHLIASWTPPVNQGTAVVTSYRVLAVQVSGPSSSAAPTGTIRVVTVQAPITKVTVRALTLDGFYKVEVAAESAAGTGASVATVSPVTPDVVVNKYAVALSAGSASALLSVSQATSGVVTLVWPVPAPAQVRALTTKSIVVVPVSSLTPEGLLVAVQAIDPTGSSGFTVTAVPANLGQVFQDLTISESGNPLSNPGAQIQAVGSGVRTLSVQQRASVTLSQTLSLDKSYGALTLSGSLNLSADASISGSLTYGFLHIPDGISLDASASVTATASMTATISASHQWEIGQITGDPFDIQVGIFPIVVVPKIPIFVDIAGDVSVSVSASVTVGAGLSWSSHSPGTLSTYNLSKKPSLGGGPVPGVSVTASGSIGIEVQPQLDLYDITGPNLDATASLSATINFLGQPFFELSPSIIIKVGWDVNLSLGPLHYERSLEVDLATLTFSGFEISSSPTAGLSLSPGSAVLEVGQVITFTPSWSSGPSKPIRWSLQGQVLGDAISSIGTLSVVEPSGRTLTVVATDSSGAVGTASVSVAPPAGAPSAPQGVGNNSVGQNSATITWSPPASDGGAPVEQYQVFIGSSVVCTTSGTSCGISGLSASSNYTVCVAAQNDVGLGPEGCTSFTTQNPPQQPSVSIAKGNVYSGNLYWTTLTVSNFPTGSGNYTCHFSDGSAYTYQLVVPSPNYTWSPSGTGTQVGCFAAGYSVWISIAASNGQTYDSNTVAL